MKTLIISVDYPLPEDKGNRMRTMHFVRFFLQHGDVDLMCYKSHAPLESSTSPFRNKFYIEMNAGNTDNNSNFINAIRDKFIDCKPWIVNNFTSDTIKQIHSVILREDYDTILCRYSVNAYPLLSLPIKYKQRVVLDIDDLMTGDLYDAMNGVQKGLSRIKAAIDKVVFHIYQMKCLKLGRVLFCSETDRSKMAKYASVDNMFVVPNIVPKQEIPEDYNRDGYNNKYLLFVGTLSYQPNEMGILWFIHEIFEKLPEKLQDFKLLIVGKAPGENLKKICSQHPKIELIANPPDVVPYFEKSFAVIVPVLVGGGTRIKILEAGNCFRPVITTKLGAHGLELEDYKTVLNFEGCEDFLNKMQWLKDKVNYKKVVKNLKIIVNSEYSENNFNNSLKKATGLSK